MVRVITVHNFLGQNVSQIEEPVATCTATSQGREMLLLALSTHCVEVWDLMNSDVKLRTVFPTVDMINQMAHCIKGDYIVTLESKCLRDTTSNNHANRVTSNFVRIYVNWAIVKDQSQPMRARIAGRVTPSLNRPLNSLEMIELPLSIQPTLIACCQSTGNLLVASGNSAILHEFKVETQQVSKIKFIDFEPRPWSLGFTFTPTHIEIVEDFIAIMDSTNLSVFRLTNSMYEDIDQLSSLTSTNSSVDKTSISTDSSLVENSNSLGNDDVQGANTKHKTVEQDCQYVTPESSEIVAIHGKSKDKKHKSTKGNTWCKLELGDFHKRKLSSNKNYIDWDYLICNEKDEMQRLVTQGIIDPASQPLTMNFPLISLERAGPGHTVSPFVLNSEDIRIFIKTTSPDEGWSENYTIKNLLCLKINTGNSNTRMDGITEVFKCLVLTPLYMKKECNITGVKKSMLRSDRYRYLQGMSCFICTTQEGYLYHFSAANNSSLDATCLTTYPFTAPVHHVALEHTQLHALTEAGLETYTLRLSHHIAKLSNCTDGVRAICPSITEPVSLIGLRPFLGIQKLLHTRNYIVLLAKAESSWTMYSLNLPKLENVYFDILNAAKNHKFSSPSTYRHMLGEAHALIRLAKDVSYKSPDNEEFDDTTHKNDLKLKNLYNQSCALLADYYIKSDTESDWDMCIPYYKMSGLKPSEVLSRKCTQDAPGLLTFLTDALLTMKSGSEADALFQGYNIIEIICKLEKKDLLKLILGSPVLREYATEKLITLLLTHETDDIVKLALALLYIQADKQEQAEKALEPVSMQYIKYIVMERWELLFDITAMKKRNPMIPTFSDFAGILMFIKNTTFAEILIELIEDEDALSLHQIIQVFLEYLPSRVGRDGYNVAATLQVFLEKYLHNYISSKSMTEWPPIVNKSQIRSDFALVEAFKLLVRSYLGKLTQTRVYKIETQENQEENDKENFIFVKYRPNYLNKMPPYAKDYKKILNMNDFKDLAKFNNETEKIIPKELFKLQSILSCEFLPVECLHEVKQFLDSQNIDGSLSLKTLCIQNTEEVTTILMDDCPQAVVQYAKDKYTKDTEWKYLIELTRDKIDAPTTQQELQLLYTQMMKEILNYLPHALPMKNVHRILPRDDMAAFQRCTEMCTKIMHADHVKSLIMETGQQLLTTLKL